MADIVPSGDNFNRRTDSWSTTEIKSVIHTHTWTVKGFSQCDLRYLETTVTVEAQLPRSTDSSVQTTTTSSTNNAQSAFNQQANLGNALVNQIPSISNAGGSTQSTGSAVHNIEPVVFRIRLHPQGNKDSNKDFTFFQAFCSQAPIKYRAKFTVYNALNQEIQTTVYTGTQQLHGYFEYIRRDNLLAHIAPQDELHLQLTLTLTADIVTTMSQVANSPATVPVPKRLDVADDFEQLYKDIECKPHLCDFKIVVRENDSDSVDDMDVKHREILCHRVVLAARSPVFAAMLENHTEEYQNGIVSIEDVDFDVMSELVYYMYSGRSPKLDILAYEILSAADRYQLLPLKDMADQMLRTQIDAERVCRVLILADMHNAESLKSECLQYIARNTALVIETDGWKHLLGSPLISQVLYAKDCKPYSGQPSLPDSSRGGASYRTMTVSQSTGPCNKRSRMDI